MANDERTSKTPVEEADHDLLIQRFAKGDDAAFRELLEREEPGLRRHLEDKTPPHVLRRLGVSDIIQRASIELLTLRKKFENRGEKAFRRLLKVIADRVTDCAINLAQKTHAIFKSAAPLIVATVVVG